MIKTDELISEAVSLPLEIRTKLIDQLLLSLNPERLDIDELWKKKVKTRLEEVKANKVELIDGEKVFNDINKQFDKGIS